MFKEENGEEKKKSNFCKITSIVSHHVIHFCQRRRSLMLNISLWTDTSHCALMRLKMDNMLDRLVVTEAYACIFVSVPSRRAFKSQDNIALGHTGKPNKIAFT